MTVAARRGFIESENQISGHAKSLSRSTNCAALCDPEKVSELVEPTDDSKDNVM